MIIIIFIFEYLKDKLTKYNFWITRERVICLRKAYWMLRIYLDLMIAVNIKVENFYTLIKLL